MKKALSRIYLGIIFLFLYAPIGVLIFFSFNESKSRSNFTGFTLNWYRLLFQDDEIMSSLRNTLIIAVLSATIATILGTLAALGISQMRKRSRTVVMNVTYIPLINPEIVTGISMMLLFVIIARLTGWDLGFWTILIAHITFNLPYVILSVLPKLRQMDPNLYEAALDLGCRQQQAVFKVVLPQIMPGLVSGFLMAFTFSLDDFIITYFTSGSSSFQTLPITIYSMTRKKVSPKINAISTLLFLAVLLILVIINLRDMRRDKREKEERI